MEEIQNQLNNNPHNLEAERYVLGSIFLDNSIMGSLKGRLKASDFYLKLHQNLFEVMEALDKSNLIIDLIHVQEYYEIKGYGTKESVLEAIVDIADSVPSVSYIDTYVEMVKEKSVERQLLVNLNQLKIDIINNNLPYNDILGNAEKNLYDLIRLQRTADTVIIGDAADEYYDEIIRRTENKGDLTGLDTGYKKLNTLTNGFQKGEFIIIAARPSVGKTAFALNLAKNMASKEDVAVGFFSLEMSVNQIMQRMYSMWTQIPSDKIRKGDLNNEEKIQLGVARQEFQKYRIYFDESGSSTIGDIRNKCRQLKQTKQLDVVIIDYLQLINTENKIRHEGVSEISRALKQLSRELEIPVIALSQLSRSIEQRDDKMPVLADLRESGSIEQDADIVMFLFNRLDIDEGDESVLDAQQEQINIPSPIKMEDGNIKDIVLLIAKNRQGQLGHVDFEFYGAESYFTQNKIQKELVRKKKRKVRK